MNSLKRIYVMLYITLAVVLTIKGLSGLISGIYPVGWAGVMLTGLPLVMMLASAMMFRKTARTRADLPVTLMLALIGLGMAGWQVLAASGPLKLLILAMAGVLGLIVYIRWYSRFGRTPSPVIEAGKDLPDFELTAVDGTKVTSTQLARQPTVFIFIRGNWCPLCMGQVNEMSGAAGDFVKAGIRVAFIAPQSVEKTKALAANRPDGIEFYSDPGNAAGRLLKIHNPAGLPLGMEILGYRSETVLPTIIAVGEGGRILWTHETDNYRVRPAPAVILKGTAAETV
ncbi:MAG: redoxin domain-containing protein [Alphaproteobacteria bacterium]|nr:redoxin domain-containing protein [Alphaproteobacteria bacterium]